MSIGLIKGDFALSSMAYFNDVTSVDGHETDQDKSSFKDKLLEKQECLNDTDKKLEIVNSNDDVVNKEMPEQGVPDHRWHDGNFGYTAYVYKNEGTESEYTVKLRYDNGRIEERTVNADMIDAASCNITDLSVKLYHLEDQGKIENAGVQIIQAQIYMRYNLPEADDHTVIDFRSRYERLLMLEIKNNGSPKYIKDLMDILKWI
ncbi:hypothetical protein [Butyrivibrio sp. INlla16]|uniref:hypothetical protein n=1 Tax=Butyrivibrio sp. INlla16 TaxID=1520807 RepID=UPI000888E0DC|nr:hypothetical protein [Butyrivibrio sp. INlla16]SDB04085.1 hypothetical protein SAMN02910263_00154 [Butyrivibrio sp. INlla16]